MGWLRWHLKQHRAVIMTAAIIVTTFLGVFVLHPDPEGAGNDHTGNDHKGSGPEWECASHPLVGPICVKKVRP